MAAEGKYSVLQLAATLCENRNNLQKKGNKNSQNCVNPFLIEMIFILLLSATNSSKYPWQGELQTTRDHKVINDILEQRSTEIRKLYEQCQDSGELFLNKFN